MELTALNVTPQGALLRWNAPVSSVDNYVLTLTRNQGMWRPDEGKHISEKLSSASFTL